MPYLDIVFHNLQNGGQGSIDGPNSRYDYTITFPYLVNVCETPAGDNGALIPATTVGETGGYASLGWGPNITAAAGVAGGACGIFFSESSPYPHIPGTRFHIGAWTSTDQITTLPSTSWNAPEWDPATDPRLRGYEGYDFVNGWVPLPGLNCPAGTVPPVPLPTFPTGSTDWLPSLGWKIQNENAPYNNWFDRPQWNGLGWTAIQPPGIPPAPAFSAVPDLTKMPQSFIPAGNDNYGSVFMEGLPDASQTVNDSLLDADWLGKSNPYCALQCVGTGDPALYNGAPPPGSDRYAIYFQAINRTFYNEEGMGDAITGLFVRTNAASDPGTQLASLCKDFPNSIIFGNLNLDINKMIGGQFLNLQSLQAAIGATHQVLAIQQPNGTYYGTSKAPGGTGDTCSDYALVPNAYVPCVELWAYRPGNDAVLSTNASDHSEMLLRIHCNDIA